MSRKKSEAEETRCIYQRLIDESPVLPPGQQIALAREAITADYERRQQIYQTLVSSNLRLALNITDKLSYRFKEGKYTEWFHEAIVGLAEAAEEYDPESGIAFSTHAYHKIFNALRHTLPNQGHIRVPSEFANVRNKVEKIRKIHGKDTPSEEIIERVLSSFKDKKRPSRETVERALKPGDYFRPLSLQQPQYLDDEPQISDSITYVNDSSIDSQVSKKFRDEASKGVITKMLETLTDAERTVITLMFGLHNGEETSMRQIGLKYLHLSRERIRQIKEDAFEKLRKFSRENNLEALLD